MKTFTMQKQIRLHRPLSEVFHFFADAANLESLAPRWLNFRWMVAPDLKGIFDYRRGKLVEISGVEREPEI